MMPYKLWGNFSAGLLGRLVNQAISFFLVVYLARVLGAEGYGEISLILAIVSYFNLLATFGLPVIGIRATARGQNLSGEAVNQIFSLRICLALLAYFLLFMYGCFFVSDEHFFSLLLFYGLTMLTSACLLDWFFVGRESLGSLAIANVIGSLCSFVLIFFLVKNATDIFYVPVSNFAGNGFTCILLLYLLRKVHVLKLKINISQVIALLKMSMPFAITAVLSQFYENFDLLMLGYLISSQEVGYYGVAYKIVAVLSGIIGIYSQSTFPVMIRCQQKGFSAMGAFLRHNMNVILFFMLPVVTGGTLLGQDIIDSFFGEAYHQAAWPFILLLYYTFFMALSITLANWLLAVNEDKKYMGTLFLGAGINFIANLLLIPLWRSAGAAAAMIIAEVVVCFFLALKVKALQQTVLFENKFICIVLCSCLLMSVVILALVNFLQLHVAVLILAGVLTYLCLVLPFAAKYIRRIQSDEV